MGVPKDIIRLIVLLKYRSRLSKNTQQYAKEYGNKAYLEMIFKVSKEWPINYRDLNHIYKSNYYYPIFNFVKCEKTKYFYQKIIMGVPKDIIRLIVLLKYKSQLSRISKRYKGTYIKTKRNTLIKGNTGYSWEINYRDLPIIYHRELYTIFNFVKREKTKYFISKNY